VVTVEPKKWAAGVADEAWKVTICALDANRASEVISALVSILTNAGSTDRGIEAVRAMSGSQIMDALIDYQSKAIKSVEAAIRKGSGDEKTNEASK